MPTSLENYLFPKEDQRPTSGLSIRCANNVMLTNTRKINQGDFKSISILASNLPATEISRIDVGDKKYTTPFYSADTKTSTLGGRLPNHNVF